MKEEDYEKISYEELTTPKDYHVCLLNRWWVLDENRNALLYKGWSPQCNVNKTIVERVSRHVEFAIIVEHIPVAYLPMKIYDRD